MNRTSTADCASCGRYIGPVMTCPYCGADAEGRTSLRWLRIAALVFGVGGLGLLFWLARHQDIPLARIADLTPAMNTARVRIAGDIVTVPRTYLRQNVPDYVTFDVSDESGTLTVAASRSVARDLIAGNGRVPRERDRIEAEGMLSLDARGRMRLYLSDASSLRTTTPAP